MSAEFLSTKFSSVPVVRRRTWVETDLAALERNLGKIKAALPAGVRYISVVKADAYGHGVVPTVSRLLQCGVDCFCVANVREGAEVRELGTGTDILVLGAVLPEERELLLGYELTAALSDSAEADALEALGAAHCRRLPVHVKIDTGMGRMGIWHERAGEFLRDVAGRRWLELRGVFTHFSSADDATPEAVSFTNEQRRRFTSALEALPAALRADPRFLVHADNSAGLATFAAGGPFNAVRAGLIQYGVPPCPDSLLARLHVEPVLSFHSRIGLVKTLPAGTAISYNRTHTLERETRVAVVTAGYGDGIPLAASKRAEVLVRGRRRRVLGRVTMDQTVIDVSEDAGGADAVAVGDVVTLIGSQRAAGGAGSAGAGDAISVTEFCEWGDTIAWDVFCSITKRVERIGRGAV